MNVLSSLLFSNDIIVRQSQSSVQFSQMKQTILRPIIPSFPHIIHLFPFKKDKCFLQYRKYGMHRSQTAKNEWNANRS